MRNPLRIIGLGVWAVAFFHVPAFAEFQTFTNSDGVSIEAELVELNEDDDIVTIKLRNGREVDADLRAFSAADRKKIKSWAKNKELERVTLHNRDRLDFTLKMNRKAKSEKYSSWYSHYDDETESFFPELLIDNGELDAFEGNEVRIVVLAEDVRNDEQVLVVSATTEKNVRLADRAQTSIEGEPFRLRKYEYKDTYGSTYNYKYGYEYDGYVVVVKNAKGEVTHTKASRSKYLSNFEVIDTCKAGEMYDDDFNRKLKIAPNSYFVR